jgi:ribosome-binding ATPase YchF (GTP1/OBG family)
LKKDLSRLKYYSYEDFIKYSSEQGVKDMGDLELEGKDYTFKIGDIVHFRFNV